MISFTLRLFPFILLPLLLLPLNGCSPVAPADTDQKRGVLLDQPFDHSLIIPVTINNTTYHFLVDTGASFTVIDAPLAKQITHAVTLSELPAPYQETAAKISTVHAQLDEETVSYITPVSLKIGNETIDDSDIWLALDLHLISESLGTHIDGILGIDVFRKFNWIVDNSSKRLIIQKSAPLAAEFSGCTGYSDLHNDHPLIALRYLNDNYINVNIDTGAETTLMGKQFLDFVKQAHRDLTPISSATAQIDASGFVDVNDFILKGLSFMGHPLGEIRVSETPDKYAVGMDFLSRFERYAIIPNKMLFCYDIASLEKTHQYPVRSIAIRYDKNNIEIYYNDERLLKPYHLENGDIIETVNGRPYLPRDINQVRQLLSFTPKGKLTLVITRQGVRQTLTL